MRLSPRSGQGAASGGAGGGGAQCPQPDPARLRQEKAAAFVPSQLGKPRPRPSRRHLCPAPATDNGQRVSRVGHLVCVHVGAGRPGAQAVECRVAAGRLRVARPLGVPGQEGLGARVRPPRTAAPLVGGWRRTAGWGGCGSSAPRVGHTWLL